MKRPCHAASRRNGRSGMCIDAADWRYGNGSAGDPISANNVILRLDMSARRNITRKILCPIDEMDDQRG